MTTRNVWGAMVVVECAVLLSIWPMFRQDARPAPSGVTFSQHVLPIYEAKCLRCHQPGGPAPFDLGQYEQAALRAQTSAYMAVRKLMPPCDAQTDFGRLCRLAPLTDKELLILKRWADMGAPEGKSRKPIYPHIPEFPDFSPTMTVSKLAPAAIPPDGPPVVIDFPLVVGQDLAGWWQGFALSRKTAHLARWAKLVRADGTAIASAALGYLSFRALPKTGFHLRKGEKVILRVRFHPSGIEEKGKVRVGFRRADSVAQPITVKAIDRRGFELAPGVRGAKESASLTLAKGTTILSIVPRLRFFCQAVKVLAVLPGGSVKTLVEIDEWSYFRRGAYNFTKPVHLPAGTVLRATFEFDNSEDNVLNPNRPPRRVRAGMADGQVHARVEFQCVEDM